jgi:hypothetical protein
MHAPTATHLDVTLGAPSAWPPGGIRVHSPLAGRPSGATAEGRPAIVEDGVVRLREPATALVIRH